MELGIYLGAARTKPLQWRQHDCTAFPAIWAGFADTLPAYSTEAEAEAMLHDAGGLLPLWRRAIAESPGRVVEVASGELEPGDVGVIELPANRTVEGVDETTGQPVEVLVVEMVELGAIWTGKRWAFVPAKGGIAAISSANCLAAWRRASCPR